MCDLTGAVFKMSQSRTQRGSTFSGCPTCMRPCSPSERPSTITARQTSTYQSIRLDRRAADPGLPLRSPAHLTKPCDRCPETPRADFVADLATYQNLPTSVRVNDSSGHARWSRAQCETSCDASRRSVSWARVLRTDRRKWRRRARMLRVWETAAQHSHRPLPGQMTPARY